MLPFLILRSASRGCKASNQLITMLGAATSVRRRSQTGVGETPSFKLQPCRNRRQKPPSSSPCCFSKLSLKPLCRALLRVDSQLRAGDRRKGGQPVRTTALVQLGAATATWPMFSVSLVANLSWAQGVASSNLAAPTNEIIHIAWIFSAARKSL